MPIFKGNTQILKRLLTPLALTGVLLAPAFAHAQTVGQAEQSPFEFHDLESNRTLGNFGRTNDEEGVAKVVEALKYAAEQGDNAARWKLGQHYSLNATVDGNHLRAFELFSEVVRSHNSTTRYSRTAPFTANAFVSLGRYYRTGIPDTYVQQNINQAWSMYLTAATVYGDSRAQFALFEMCENDLQGRCSQIHAQRWLKKSAVNGHIAGQAHFGLRQFEGLSGVRQNKVSGLKWISIARERAHRLRDDWVFELHEKVFSLATPEERNKARVDTERWMSTHCLTGGVCR